MSEDRLREIKARAGAATPGPWRWAGNVDVHHIELTTVDRGMLYIMRLVRWGTQSAQPMFQPVGDKYGPMVKATDVPIFEVAPSATSRDDERVYRGDLTGLRHPDAEFIARSRADVDWLIAEVDRLRQGLWDVARISGSDITDDTPDHMVYPDIVDYAKQEVQQLRDDYDEALRSPLL